MIEELKEKLELEANKLQFELNVTLPNEIRKAVELGDLRENSEYKAALERQQFVQARLGQLRQRLSKLSQIDVTQIPHDKVGLGSRVVVKDENDGRRGDLQPRVRRLGGVRGRPRHHVVADRPRARRQGGGRARDAQAPAATRRLEIIELKTIHVPAA